jgi:hypothetical protein
MRRIHRPAVLYKAPQPGFRYWRLTATSWTSGSFASGNTGTNHICRIDEWKLLVGATAFPVAAMTADNAPAPLLSSASSILGAGFEPFRAFDQIMTDSGRWICGNPPGGPEWVQIDLGAGKAILPTTTTVAPDGGVSTAPNGNYLIAFRIEASNTGAFAGEQVLFLNVSGLAVTDWAAFTNKTFALNATL